MKLAVLDRTFSPSLSTPVTFDRWLQVNDVLDGCLETRQVHWLQSLISTTGDRSICLFQVPYVNAVGEACRVAQMPYQALWQADLWWAEIPEGFPQGASLIVSEVSHDSPASLTAYEAIRDQARDFLDELQVYPAFSITALDGTRSVFVFTASSLEDVRSLYQKVGMPVERIWKATLILPMAESVRSRE